MKKINLLIVDDKIENIISLTALLTDIENINIISSEDPNEALRICYKQNIDIALVDVQMPEINGFEFVSLIKHNPKTSHIIAIMVTAISKEEKYLIKGLNSGAVDYLYKPLSPEITIAKVQSFIQQVQTQNEIKEKNIALEKSKIELIRAKEEAELARKSKETFLANMSHEIRTPINGVMGIAQMLKNSSLSPEQQDWVNKLNSASLSLLNIVNDILDLSKFDSGMMKLEFEPTSVHDITDDLKNLFVDKAIHKGLQFYINIDEKIDSFFLTDPFRLKQILTNFISNSFKFTSKGHIELNINLIDSNDHQLCLQFQVKDTGIGIPHQSLEKIFFAFEQGEDGITKKFGGTGLGLAIVKRLSTLLEGKVTASSSYGEGSEFTFECWFDRVSTVVKAKPEKILYSELSRFNNLKILVAEDNELNSFMLASILKTWNCEVDTAINGQIALEKVENNDYSIVFMDSHMPVMSGFDTIRNIRNNPNPTISNMLIISISASVLEAEQQEAFDAGANEVIGKPFDPIQLHAVIEKLLLKKNN
ncbi:response regulator [Sphingobacterium sp. SRCM116780]|uniref:response regulator n=1 Tax=Sphingobacterium sp. SRCM116780 TaxID=2907623 RepID=UPI001F319910|nr:response regulator [Sphingobacterium sp. SRCM116780]UIR55188.1 response regulator [Sphingobacterium sp. SRCM116780]